MSVVNRGYPYVLEISATVAAVIDRDTPPPCMASRAERRLDLHTDQQQAQLEGSRASWQQVCCACSYHIYERSP